MQDQENQSDIQAESPVATEAAAATQKALALLARCEQCRAGLTRKLLAKGFSKGAIDGVLDALEEKGFLSDQRFARAWLNSRRIGKTEGRIRLLAELSARGIEKDVAKKAVDDFFEEFDEDAICLAAAKKYIGRGMAGEKLMAAMTRAGFSFKMIQKAIKNLEENLDSVRDF